MTARILDGKAVAERLSGEVRDAVDARRRSGRSPPGLAVVLVGENAASQVYVRNKRKMTEGVGMRSFAFDLAATAPERELLALIDRLNADPAVNGILVQLPLGKQIDAAHVIERIDWRKDVDGLHPYNMGRLVLKMPTRGSPASRRGACAAYAGARASDAIPQRCFAALDMTAR